MKLLNQSSLAIQLLAGCFFISSACGLSVQELRNKQHLTPEEFATYFADFKFQFHDDVQDHNIFVASKSGDCDDYATLAADVLSRYGYTPRLIAVRMKGETHVVCYIEETKSYLDYNARKDQNKMISCTSGLTDIAKSVATSFCKDWIATYEFTYSKKERIKRLVNQIVYQTGQKPV